MTQLDYFIIVGVYFLCVSRVHDIFHYYNCYRYQLIISLYTFLELLLFITATLSDLFFVYNIQKKVPLFFSLRQGRKVNAIHYRTQFILFLLTFDKIRDWSFDEIFCLAWFCRAKSTLQSKALTGRLLFCFEPVQVVLCELEYAQVMKKFFRHLTISRTSFEPYKLQKYVRWLCLILGLGSFSEAFIQVLRFQV